MPWKVLSEKKKLLSKREMMTEFRSHTKPVKGDSE